MDIFIRVVSHDAIALHVQNMMSDVRNVGGKMSRNNAKSEIYFRKNENKTK